MENLNGTILRVTTRYDNAYPYDVQVEKYDERNSSNSYALKGGFAINLFLELSQFLNFSYELVPNVSAYDFSRATEAMIDLYASSYSLIEGRAKIVDYTFQIGKSKVAAFINHKFESSMADTIFGPFATSLWLGLLGFFVILSGAMICVFIWEKQSAIDAHFQCLALFLQKDCGLLHLERASSKILVWVICMSSVLVYSTYTGNIVSIKSVSRYFVTSLEALVNSNYEINLEFGYNNGSTIQIIAEAIQENPTMVQLLEKSSQSKFVFQNFAQAIREVEESSVAYIIDEETGFAAVKSELGHFPCTWGTIPFAGVEYPWAMYMRKKSPYRTALNFGLLKLHEVGLTGIIRKRWVPQFEECLVQTKDFAAVSALELRFAYLILFIGFLIALIILLGERVTNNRK